MEDITVILNGFKRPQYFKTQLEAINNQTVKPKSIMLWQNSGAVFDKSLTKDIIHTESNHNFGVWARFAYALNAKTEYVCIFDDDTIPSPKWLENCLNTIKTHNGLLGTIGVVFKSKSAYQPITRYGWADNNNDGVVEVDIVGHSWFFRRDWLKYFWCELPKVTDSELVGEDMHFSYMLWKYANIKTYVPPHPKSDISLWGSNPNLGWKMGQDAAAISMKPNNLHKMNAMFVNNIKSGYVPLKFREK
jgi:hypothetical protein